MTILETENIRSRCLLKSKRWAGYPDKTSAGVSSNSADDIHFTYDLLGRRTSANHANFGLDFRWDNAGRLTETVAGGQTGHYQYDAAGNRTRLTWPDGFYVTTDYDALNRPTTLKEQGSVPLAGYAYDDLSRRRTVTLGNGTTTTLDYDNQSALSGLSHAFVGGSGNIAFSFTRNQAGEIVGHSWNNDRYLWTAANVNPTYAANGLNQYTAVGSRTLTYDARANLTGDGPWTYAYDSDNRLRTARSTQLNATLDYDPIGRLRQTTFNAEWALIYNGSMDIPIVVPLSTPVTRTTRLLYDGTDLIAEYDGAALDTAQRRHVHGPGIDEPLVTYAGSGTGNKTWLYSDHQGSVVAQAGASGANTAIDAYGPFGETDPAAGTRFGYTGQRYLSPLGLYDYKARFYSPTLGRFLQTDPVGYRDDNNLYAYVGNNPVNRRDPWGLSRLAVGREMPVMLADGGGAMKVLTTVTDTPATGYLFNHVTTCGCMGSRDSRFGTGTDLDVALPAGKPISTWDKLKNWLFSNGKESPVPDATPGRETKGRSTLWEKPGGMPEADRDFDRLSPGGVRDLPNGGRVGTLPDGRTIIVRPDSTDGGRPTVEIQSGKNREKVRYNP